MGVRWEEQTYKPTPAEETQSPTRSFIVSTVFSAFILLSYTISFGESNLHLSAFNLRDLLHLLDLAWFPAFLSLLLNPAPFWRFYQSLMRLQKGLP